MVRITRIACAAGALLLLSGRPGRAVEHLVLQRDGKAAHVSGKPLVEAEDGGLLLLVGDGELWIVQPEEIERRRADQQPFQWLDHSGLGQRLLQQAPAGFRLHETAHYVIAYNTSPA